MNTSSFQSRLRTLRTRIKHERGAVLVEAAICIPLLLLVILGSVEAGTAWEAKSSTVSGVRTGVLRASTIGDRPETDLRIIQSVLGEIGADNVDGLDWIMVFDAEGDSDAAYNTCLGGNDVNPAGGLGCVVYNNAFVDSVVSMTDPVAFQATNFDTGIGGTPDPLTGRNTSYTCDNTKFDANWCAGLRTIGGDTQIGVAIRYNHEWTTGIFPFDPPVFQEYVISSTFSDGGSEFTPGTPVVGPFAAGTLLDTDFGAGFDPAVPGSGVTINTTQTTQSPNGADYLGPFSSETITIDLENLTPGYEVCISFDLYLVGTWDSDNNEWGPDTIDVSLGGTTRGPRTYERNNDPDASANDSLGYSDDSTIPITICEIVPASGELTLSITGALEEGDVPYTGTSNESWGVDNMLITSAP